MVALGYKCLCQTARQGLRLSHENRIPLCNQASQFRELAVLASGVALPCYWSLRSRVSISAFHL